MVDSASIAVLSDVGARRDGRDLPRGHALPFSAVTVHATLAAAAADWHHLQSSALMSPYQRWDWIDAWMATDGEAAGIKPFIVVARDADRAPVALLPFGLSAAGRLRRAIFLGGRQTNYNMGLFDPCLCWSPRDAALLLGQAARSLPGGVDLYALVNQPLGWGAFRNPLVGLPQSQPSPSSSHRAALLPDAEALMRSQQSAAARKKLRAKAAHLQAVGPVSHRIARTPDEVEAVVTAHLDQKAAKLAVLGIQAPDRAALRKLLLRGSLPAAGRSAPIELHALYCGEAIVATFGGIAHAGRFSGLLISYALDPAYARSSPGELLLNAVIRRKCAEGFEGFDLGIGESRYKDTYCPIVDPLVDSFLPLTLAGRAAMLATVGQLRVKGAIKSSPRAWAAVQRVRRQIGRLRQPDRD